MSEAIRMLGLLETNWDARRRRLGQWQRQQQGELSPEQAEMLRAMARSGPVRAERRGRAWQVQDQLLRLGLVSKLGDQVAISDKGTELLNSGRLGDAD